MCDAYVTDHSLTMVDQHLILGTAGFWRLVGPADCALRAHFHEKVRCLVAGSLWFCCFGLLD